MLRPLNLEELKVEAEKQNHLVIRRDGEISWRPLKNWKGHSTGATYFLIENRVLAKNALNEQVQWYTLS